MMDRMAGVQDRDGRMENGPHVVEAGLEDVVARHELRQGLAHEGQHIGCLVRRQHRQGNRVLDPEDVDLARIGHPRGVQQRLGLAQVRLDGRVPLADDLGESQRPARATRVQDDDLAVPQVRGEHLADAAMGRGRHDHHDDVHTDGLLQFRLTPKAVAPALPAEPSPDAPVPAPMPLAQRTPAPSRGVDGEDAEAVFLQELAYAESRFKSGYVGLNYFLRKWKSHKLARDFQARNRILQKLLNKGKVERFDAPMAAWRFAPGPCRRPPVPSRTRLLPRARRPRRVDMPKGRQ